VLGRGAAFCSGGQPGLLTFDALSFNLPFDFYILHFTFYIPSGPSLQEHRKCGVQKVAF